MKLFKRLFGRGKKKQSYQDWLEEENLTIPPMPTVKEPKIDISGYQPIDRPENYKLDDGRAIVINANYESNFINCKINNKRKPHIWYDLNLKTWLCSEVKYQILLSTRAGKTAKRAYENYIKQVNKWQ